jgi:DnaJ-class molecular chaperone
MKITCYICDGDGTVPIRFKPWHPFASREEPCPNCDGSGQHENNNDPKEENEPARIESPETGGV